MTPSDLLNHALAADPSRPLVTYLDDRTGERTELSVVTFDNWVAKTANFLVDGLAVEPGARVAVRLPLHWQSLVWIAACWASGCVAVLAGDPADADVVVVGPDDVPDGTAGEVVALALRPLAMPGTPPPAGVTDYDVEVRAYGDRFAPYAPVPPTAPAIEVDGHRLDAAGVVAAAEDAVRRWELHGGDRVLIGWSLDHLDGVLAALVAPLSAGASSVLWAAPDPARLGHLTATEQLTAAAGVDVPTSSPLRALEPAGP